jgi:hypothetical protein
MGAVIMSVRFLSRLSPTSIQQNILLDRKMPFKSSGLGNLTRLNGAEYDSEKIPLL